MIYSLKRFASLLLTIAVSVSQVSAATYTKSDYQVPFELNIGPYFASDHTPEAHVQTPGLNRSAAIVVGTEAVLITGIMASLYSSWYSGTETGGFHFYNDSREWLMMDKLGHANSCYNFANIGYEALVMTGLDERRSLLYGAPLGITIMTMVEVFDGLSGNWGFSWGDMTANILGTGLFMGQQALWHEQRIALKYSYHNSGLAKYNVSNPLTMERDYIMGRDWLDRLYEDYGGITIWAAFDVKSLFMNDDSRYPSWLGWAVGFGAEGMTGEYNNLRPAGSVGADGNWGRGWEYDPVNAPGQLAYLPDDARQRRLFLAPDIDISRIPCRNKTLKHVLRVLSAIKLPTPAVEYRPGESRLCWHWLYF